MPGAVLEQPYALLVLGKTLREYARAWATYRQDPDHCSAPVKSWVMRITAASVMERAGGGN